MYLISGTKWEKVSITTTLEDPTVRGLGDRKIRLELSEFARPEEEHGLGDSVSARCKYNSSAEDKSRRQKQLQATLNLY